MPDDYDFHFWFAGHPKPEHQNDLPMALTYVVEPNYLQTFQIALKRAGFSAIATMNDRGKLSLDDTVSKYLPELIGARQVTIRELLSHTSGYRGYFLQEYIPVQMQRPITVDSILRTWAERPLDFAPGDEWQYQERTT